VVFPDEANPLGVDLKQGILEPESKAQIGARLVDISTQQAFPK